MLIKSSPSEIIQFADFLKSQLVPLPYPTANFAGQTIIVTGANTGLGLEAARHFVRLGAAKVILACRDVEKGEAAVRGIDAPLDVAEVWHVDLCNHESVKEFCARAQKLDRLDVLVENAAVKLPYYEEVESMETVITVNVISTFLMAMLLLPKLHLTGARNNVIPHLVIVGSNAHTEVISVGILQHITAILTGQRRYSRNRTTLLFSKPSDRLTIKKTDTQLRNSSNCWLFANSLWRSFNRNNSQKSS